MLTSAFIRTSFVADTFRHNTIEITVARPIPHKVVRLIPAAPRQILPESLRPYAHTNVTAAGLHVAVLPYVRPFVIKYPAAKSPKQAHAPGGCDK